MAQGFSPAIKATNMIGFSRGGRMAIPYRGRTDHSTYFITASTYNKERLFQSDAFANLLMMVFFQYRDNRKYLLHEFVIMPNHFHLLLTPEVSLERALQLIKGGFSFRMNRELGFGGQVWQSSFYDHRVRDAEEYTRIRQYIRQNPARAGIIGEYRYSSANPEWSIDNVPQRLKPYSLPLANPQG